MRALLILMLLCSHDTDPAGMDYRPIYQEEFGQPCSTTTDIVEHTCSLEIRSRPKWRKHEN